MRFFSLFFLCFLLVSISVGKTAGTGIPPDESKTIGKQVPNVILIDSSGKGFKLHDLKGKPLILSFIYTHCNSACPIITENLKKTLNSTDGLGRDFLVLSITFDPQDTLADIKRFKLKHNLPQGWKVALVKDKDQLFELLDAVDFRFVTLPGKEFIHPNLLVFLDKDLTIRKYMYGVSFDRLEFANALRIAKGDLALPDKFRGHLFLVGMIGFLGTLVFSVVKLTRIRIRKEETSIKTS